MITPGFDNESVTSDHCLLTSVNRFGHMTEGVITRCASGVFDC